MTNRFYHILAITLLYSFLGACQTESTLSLTTLNQPQINNCYDDGALSTLSTEQNNNGLSHQLHSQCSTWMPTNSSDLSEFCVNEMSLNKLYSHQCVKKNEMSEAQATKFLYYCDVLNMSEVSQGLLIYIEGSTTPQKRKTNSGLGDNRVNGVYVDSNNIIYAATNNGLSISSDGGQKFHNFTDGLGWKVVNNVYVDKNNFIYAATTGGLSISSNAGQSFQTFLNSIEIQDVYLDDSEYIYASTTQGLLRTSHIDGSYTVILAQHTVNSTYTNKNRIIYAATTNGLHISRDDGSTFESRTTSHGLGDNLIWDVVGDESGNIYAATNGGLSISSDNGQNFHNKTTSDGLGGNLVQKVFVDNRGYIFAATTGGLSLSINGGGEIY